jgi:hypothetical protein
MKSWFYDRIAALIAWYTQRDVPAATDAEKI